MTSWILAALTLAVFLLAAGAAWWAARRGPLRQRRSTYWKMWLLVACGVVFSSYAFWADSQLRQTTLHEVILDGADAEMPPGGQVVRQVEFVVAHPQVEHDLMICPMYRGPTIQRADFEVKLAATLARNGDAPMLDDEYTFAPRFQDKNWRAEYLSFTPQAAGPHTLTLRLLTPGIPAVHVRVADPLNTVGERAPGY